MLISFAMYRPIFLLVVFLFFCFFLTACFWRNKDAYIITAGTWNQSAIELIQKMLVVSLHVTEDTIKERRCSCSSAYLLLFKGGAVTFLATFDAAYVIPRRGRCFCLV